MRRIGSQPVYQNVTGWKPTLRNVTGWKPTLRMDRTIPTRSAGTVEDNCSTMLLRFLNHLDTSIQSLVGLIQRMLYVFVLVMNERFHRNLRCFFSVRACEVA